jgi:hypothetical protein
MVRTLDNLEVGVTSYLHQFGHTDDGVPFIGEVYHLLAEDADGNRWSHSAKFPGVGVLTDEFGQQYFSDIRDQATARAEALLARVIARGTIDLYYWEMSRPAYGSKAYEKYGQEDDVMWEKEVG